MKSFLLVTILFLFQSYKLLAQNLYPEKFSGCVTNAFALEGHIQTQSNKDTLLQAFLSNIPEDKLHKLIGIIYIQVIVDSVGNPCCFSIQNKSNTSSEKLKIDEIVNAKTRWSPPVIEDNIVNKVSAVIKLIFESNKISLERMGYNGKTGWVSLEHAYINK